MGHAPEGVGVDQIWRLLPGMEITILYNVGEGGRYCVYDGTCIMNVVSDDSNPR